MSENKNQSLRSKLSRLVELLRIIKKKTRADIAKEIGITGTTLLNIEKNHTNYSIDNISKLLTLFDVEILVTVKTDEELLFYTLDKMLATLEGRAKELRDLEYATGYSKIYQPIDNGKYQAQKLEQQKKREQARLEKQKIKEDQRLERKKAL